MRELAREAEVALARLLEAPVLARGLGLVGELGDPPVGERARRGEVEARDPHVALHLGYGHELEVDAVSALLGLEVEGRHAQARLVLPRAPGDLDRARDLDVLALSEELLELARLAVRHRELDGRDLLEPRDVDHDPHRAPVGEVLLRDLPPDLERLALGLHDGRRLDAVPRGRVEDRPVREDPAVSGVARGRPGEPGRLRRERVSGRAVGRREPEPDVREELRRGAVRGRASHGEDPAAARREVEASSVERGRRGSVRLLAQRDPVEEGGPAPARERRGEGEDARLRRPVGRDERGAHVVPVGRALDDGRVGELGAAGALVLPLDREDARRLPLRLHRGVERERLPLSLGGDEVVVAHRELAPSLVVRVEPHGARPVEDALGHDLAGSLERPPAERGLGLEGPVREEVVPGRRVAVLVAEERMGDRERRRDERDHDEDDRDRAAGSALGALLERDRGELGRRDPRLVGRDGLDRLGAGVGVGGLHPALSLLSDLHGGRPPCRSERRLSAG